MNSLEVLDESLNLLNESEESDNISDGNHTFGELYDHRTLLFINLCKLLKEKGYYVWKSIRNSEGEDQEDYFLMGINKEPGKQMSYHCVKDKYYDMASFADELDKAPDFDGHSSDDVLIRLEELLKQ